MSFHKIKEAPQKRNKKVLSSGNVLRHKDVTKKKESQKITNIYINDVQNIPKYNKKYAFKENQKVSTLTD